MHPSRLRACSALTKKRKISIRWALCAIKTGAKFAEISNPEKPLIVRVHLKLISECVISLFFGAPVLPDRLSGGNLASLPFQTLPIRVLSEN